MPEPTRVLQAGDVVARNQEYQVVVGGEYELTQLVPCRRLIETNEPTCAFLCEAVVGADLSQENP